MESKMRVRHLFSSINVNCGGFYGEEAKKILEDFKVCVDEIEYSLSLNEEFSEMKPLIRKVIVLLEALYKKTAGLAKEEGRDFCKCLVDSSIYVISLIKRVSESYGKLHESYSDFLFKVLSDVKAFSIKVLTETFRGVDYNKLESDVKAFEWLWKEGKVYPMAGLGRYQMERFFNDFEIDDFAKGGVREIVGLYEEIIEYKKNYHQNYPHPLQGENRFFYEKFHHINHF